MKTRNHVPVALCSSVLGALNIIKPILQMMTSAWVVFKRIVFIAILLHISAWCSEREAVLL